MNLAIAVLSTVLIAAGPGDKDEVTKLRDDLRVLNDGYTVLEKELKSKYSTAMITELAVRLNCTLQTLKRCSCIVDELQRTITEQKLKSEDPDVKPLILKAASTCTLPMGQNLGQVPTSPTQGASPGREPQQRAGMQAAPGGQRLLQLLVGEWSYTDATLRDTVVAETYVFKEDMTFTHDFVAMQYGRKVSEPDSGTYRIDGERVIMTFKKNKSRRTDQAQGVPPGVAVYVIGSTHKLDGSRPIALQPIDVNTGRSSGYAMFERKP